MTDDTGRELVVDGRASGTQATDRHHHRVTANESCIVHLPAYRVTTTR